MYLWVFLLRCFFRAIPFGAVDWFKTMIQGDEKEKKKNKESEDQKRRKGEEEKKRVKENK